VQAIQPRQRGRIARRLIRDFLTGPAHPPIQTHIRFCGYPRLACPCVAEEC
jgi:hypothetical protein